MSITLKKLSSKNNKNIDFHDSDFSNLPSIDIDYNTKLFYQYDGYTLEFVVLEFNQSLCSEDFWTNPESELIVDADFFGVICFDGIRHCYMPYGHYVNEFKLIKILQELNKLAKKHIENYTEA